MMIKSPWPTTEMALFLENYFYSPAAFSISTINQADPTTGEIRAECAPLTSWLIAPHQRGDETVHPRHVSGGDLVMLTASLGSLHAYFFHGCKWQEGWVGFGNRMENVVFHNLARVDRRLELASKEIKVRVGSKRVLLEFGFEFTQDGKQIYSSQQTALFVRNGTAAPDKNS